MNVKKKRDLGLTSYKQETAGVGGFAEKGFCLGCGVALQRALQWHFFLTPDDKK